MVSFFLIKSGIVGSRNNQNEISDSTIVRPSTPYRLANLEEPYASGNLAYSYLEPQNFKAPFLVRIKLDEDDYSSASNHFENVPFFAQAYIKKENPSDTTFTEQNIPVDVKNSSSDSFEDEEPEPIKNQSGGCAVLVGLYDSENNADKIVKRLKDLNYDALKVDYKNRIRVKVAVPCEGPEKTDILEKIREDFAPDAYIEN